jgi:hypothetical protein
LASVRRVENEAVESVLAVHTLKKHHTEATIPKYLMSLTTMQLWYRVYEQFRPKARSSQDHFNYILECSFWEQQSAHMDPSYH